MHDLVTTLLTIKNMVCFRVSGKPPIQSQSSNAPKSNVDAAASPLNNCLPTDFIPQIIPRSSRAASANGAGAV